MSMIGLVEAIKEVVCSTVESMKMTKVMYGTVQSLEPLQIFISQDFILPEGALVVPQHLKPYQAKTEEEYPVPVTIDNALHSGDRVVLIRAEGGQKYVIAGRL